MVLVVVAEVLVVVTMFVAVQYVVMMPVYWRRRQWPWPWPWQRQQQQYSAGGASDHMVVIISDGM